MADGSSNGPLAGIGMVVIGDEILSGRRRDRHLAAVTERLAARGLVVDWAQFLPDREVTIVDLLQRSRADGATVFCFGGIGATPDDLTRACAAMAFGRPLVRHAEAAALIEAQFGEAAYPKRMLMADLPEGAELVPNPVNRVPGFALERHFFLPGFPEMAHRMLDGIFAGPLADLGDAGYVERSVWLVDTPESELVDLMEAFCAAHPALRLFSLPVLSAERRLLELGFTGERTEVERAMAELVRALAARGTAVHDERPA
ncbi:competence/damage-inducible protein A [Guyparkeria hydrothermalis]|uniref:competence/damage-inducible protein A n=1 Tax=Guyparkeria hydrothermalis TaxID=923 RepID=UPI0020205F05|nr:competence/damage-inducible protein A [Guyparkeria hydrothermalis]MCL7744983.1 competence/damage-inducible protein A [Guyparkeria hydrothermalis]